MVLDMQVDPEEYPVTQICLHRLFATLVLNKDMPRIIMQDGKMHLINLL